MDSLDRGVRGELYGNISPEVMKKGKSAVVTGNNPVVGTRVLTWKIDEKKVDE
ncbi:MAG TPA: hypothetical protein VGG64_09425 [Pirellulales bacterium]|jgi:hypothetical protein